MTHSALRCGRISYTNDLPVYAAFDAGAVEFPGELVAGVPTTLNRAMLAGELDCGPISTYFYAQHPETFALLPRVCIGSRRDVRSIYLLSHSAPSDLETQTIAVTTESSTGRALFETICRRHYGFAPSFVETADPLQAFRDRGTPSVLIGDKAIDAYLADPSHAYDLGTLWHGFSGTDMVYAVWAVRRHRSAEADRSNDYRSKAVADVVAALAAALRWGFDHLDAVVARAQAAAPRPDGFYADYYAALNFSFDERAQHGLRSFFDAAAQCGLLESSPALDFFNEELERV